MRKSEDRRWERPFVIIRENYAEIRLQRISAAAFFVVAAGMEIPPLHGTDGGHNI